MTAAAWRLVAAALWLSQAPATAGIIAIVHYDARLQVDAAGGV